MKTKEHSRSRFFIQTYLSVFRFEAVDMPFRGFVCSVCGRDFLTASGLRKHSITKHEIDKFKYACDECGKSFIDSEQVIAHKISKHGQNGMACEICHKKFTRQANLRRHKRYHCNSTAVLKCNACDKFFKRQDSLEEHKECVHGLRHKFKCEKCGAEYKYRGSLSKHKTRKH